MAHKENGMAKMISAALSSRLTKGAYG